MALEGSVKDFGVVDIFQLIAMQKKAGVLTLSHGDKTVLVSFINGNIVNAVEGDENERFSNALITAEKVSMTQLRAALRMVEKEVPLGETFVKLAHLTPEEVKGWNQTLTQETVFDLLSWESGSYRFDQQDTFLKSDYYPPISVERILMEGMRQKDEWPALLKRIPSKTMVFEIVEKPKEAGDSFSSQYETNGEGSGSIEGLLDTEEHAWLLQWINGVRTVEDVVSHAGVGAFPVYKCLGELVAEGRLKERAIKTDIKKRRSIFESLNEIVFTPLLLNKLLVVFAVAVSTTLFIPSFYGVRSIFQKIGGSIEEFRKLAIANQKDIIAFSLDLYYLKHNRYPDTLHQLRADGFMNTEQEQEIDLEAFRYRPNGKTYELVLGNQ